MPSAPGGDVDGGLTMSDLVQQILAKTVEEGDCLIW